MYSSMYSCLSMSFRWGGGSGHKTGSCYIHNVCLTADVNYFGSWNLNTHSMQPQHSALVTVTNRSSHWGFELNGGLNSVGLVLTDGMNT